MEPIIKKELTKISFFIRCLKESYRELKIKSYFADNQKKLQKASSEQGDVFVDAYPLILGKCQKVVLYRQDAQEELSRLLGKEIPLEEIHLVSLSARYSAANLNKNFLTSVWLFQNRYFIELGISDNRKRSLFGVVDESVFSFTNINHSDTMKALNIAYYSELGLSSIPKFFVLYKIIDGDVSLELLIHMKKQTFLRREVVCTYEGRKPSFSEILEKIHVYKGSEAKKSTL